MTMTSLVNNICFSLFLVLVPFNMNGQSSMLTQAQNKLLPKVFLLGEYEANYEKAIPEYGQLLAVCNNDIKVAFEKWLSMTLEMEAYATQIDYNLKGLKIWIHVFWKKDGSIEHIGYHLKPNSRNVDIDELNVFFSNFMNEYHFPLIADSKYSHYTTISFPVFSKRINRSTTKNDP